MADRASRQPHLLVMWVLCLLVTMIGCAALEYTFHSMALTAGVGALMGLSSGFFCARDEYLLREADGK